MNLEIVQSAESQRTATHTPGSGFADLNKQILRVLRCSASALANSPGGLRFKAGTRPWLEGLQPSALTLSGQATDRQRKPNRMNSFNAA